MKDFSFVCQIPSESNPDKLYTIKLNEDGLLTCDCPSWIYNQRKNRTCKHIDKLREAGFESDKTGKFIKINEGKWTSSLYYCKKYPEGCVGCSLRYQCFVEKDPTFDVESAEKANLLNEEEKLWVMMYDDIYAGKKWVAEIDYSWNINMTKLESRAKVFTDKEKDIYEYLRQTFHLTWVRKIKV